MGSLLSYVSILETMYGLREKVYVGIVSSIGMRYIDSAMPPMRCFAFSRRFGFSYGLGITAGFWTGWYFGGSGSLKSKSFWYDGMSKFPCVVYGVASVLKF
jgi:hypothetical protein